MAKNLYGVNEMKRSCICEEKKKYSGVYNSKGRIDKNRICYLLKYPKNGCLRGCLRRKP